MKTLPCALGCIYLEENVSHSLDEIFDKKELNFVFIHHSRDRYRVQNHTQLNNVLETLDFYIFSFPFSNSLFFSLLTLLSVFQMD